jgi:hypothetical protein
MSGSVVDEEWALFYPYARRRNGRDSGALILRNGTFAGGRAEVFGITLVGN